MLSPLCRVFTIIYHKQTMSLRYTVLQLFCIYSYIPATNHVSTVHSVAALLYLQSVPHVMLFRPWNMFCTFTLALPVVCVCVCVCAVHNMDVFCSTLISCFPVMLLRCCLGDFEMVPVAPIIIIIIIIIIGILLLLSSSSSSSSLSSSPFLLCI